MADVTLYGLHDLDNEIVTVYLAGIDMGDWPVVDGKLVFDFTGAEEIAAGLTKEYLIKIGALNRDYGYLSVTLLGKYKVPVAIGYRYRSAGQRLRPGIAEDVGTAAGPGFGKFRRNHQYAALFWMTKGVLVGTEGEKNLAQLRSPGGRTPEGLELFSGIITDTLQDDSSYDGAISWESTAVWPCNIAALGGFLMGQDK